MKDLIEASEDRFFVVLGDLPLGDLPLPQTASQPASSASATVSATSLTRGSSVKSGRGGDDRTGSGRGHRTDRKSHFGNGVFVAAGSGLNHGRSGSPGRSRGRRGRPRSVSCLGLGLRAQVEFRSRSVHAAVGAAVEAAQAVVRTIDVVLAGRPTIGDDSGTFGVGQRINSGAVSVSASVISIVRVTESVLRQTVVRFGSGAIHVVPA